MGRLARIIIFLIVGAFVLTYAGYTTVLAEKTPRYGKHLGELKNLEISVVYTDPYFYTEEGLAGYYISLPMTYEIHIKNNGKSTFKHLDITAIHEYYESGTCDRWWYPYPREVTYAKGEPLPGDATEVWEDITLERGEEIVLKDSYIPTLATCDGLDQTHLIIKHTNKGRETAAVMYYEPEAGVFCPPPPEE
ncbi:MAG: hypothetical protein V3T58_00815 [Candidatus Hydrothermarchaeales archaeon]